MTPYESQGPNVRPSSQPLKPTLGWCEWLALPDLGIGKIKAKVDTGAKTSTLHAKRVQHYRARGKDWVEFTVYPFQRNSERTVIAQAHLVDIRWVKSSVGHRTRRAVVETTVSIGPHSWPIELTLVDRDLMGFRMLLGRQAVGGRFLIDPAHMYLLGRRPKTKKRPEV